MNRTLLQVAILLIRMILINMAANLLVEAIFGLILMLWSSQQRVTARFGRIPPF